MKRTDVNARTGRGCWLAHYALTEWRDYRRYGSGAGYPSMSSDAAARERARTATRVDGAAAYRGRVDVGDAGKSVPREPPPMPKETRQPARARIPEIHGIGGIGRDVDRALGAAWVVTGLHSIGLLAALFAALALWVSAGSLADDLGSPHPLDPARERAEAIEMQAWAQCKTRETERTKRALALGKLRRRYQRTVDGEDGA